MSKDPIDALAIADGTELVHASAGAMSAIVASEVSVQLDAAHRYPRSFTKFMSNAKNLVTRNKQIAESCMYSLPRGGKMITGPSVRLAEICASAYGNLQIATRVIGIDDTEVIAQGAAWDMEQNVRVTVEARRRIVKSDGKRYDDSMINVTGAAGSSVALRNAIFRVIPRAYIDELYDHARTFALGDAKDLPVRREEIIGQVEKTGVSRDRVFARLGRVGIEDVTRDDLETLLGIGNAIKDKSLRIEEAFPESEVPALGEPAQDGKRMSLRKGKV